LEIVSQPDLRSPLEAKTFLTELKLLLTYLDVSDCNMQEGSLRVDANVNLHIDSEGGQVATPIVEVKNMNSFRAVERALAYEADRQYEVWQETGQKLGDVPKQTRGWDDAAGVTRGQRHKEESSDYRYFPDPDLVPVIISPEEVEQVRADLGELPAVLRDRLVREFDITPYDADVLVNQGRGVVDYFVRVAEQSGDGKQASNWVQRDVLRAMKEQNLSIDALPVTANSLAELIQATGQGKLDSSRARDVFTQMLSERQSMDEAIAALGITQVDESELVDLCRELLAANPQIVADIKEGKKKAAGALVGQAKKHNPNVNPARVMELCVELAGQM
jgi:aspartyl-tRNA(Asn)/glutamyl-tRNA(Gln) amidotransferase subunit B